jgi:glycosyltransferase involved in cell wall biosynthesis
MRPTRIVRVSLSRTKFGGGAYEHFIDEAFSNRPEYEYSVLQLDRGNSRFLSWLRVARFIVRLVILSFRDVVIVNQFHTIPFMPLRRNVVTVLHHIGAPRSDLRLRVIDGLSAFVLRHVYSRSNTIVVVSRYWLEKVRAMGFTNVVLIYNCFELEKYDAVTAAAASAFRATHGLTGKPLVFIGNPQAKKGYREVYEALKDEGYHLVTSGQGDPNLPARHFDLEHRDYLCLLKSADLVITASIVTEGWCRVAHEAILLGTPVLGSGAGGMGELLDAYDQPVIRSMTALRDQVRQVLAAARPVPANLARRNDFAVKTFAESWRRAVSRNL